MPDKEVINNNVGGISGNQIRGGLMLGRGDNAYHEYPQSQSQSLSQSQSQSQSQEMMNDGQHMVPSMYTKQVSANDNNIEGELSEKEGVIAVKDATEGNGKNLPSFDANVNGNFHLNAASNDKDAVKNVSLGNESEFDAKLNEICNDAGTSRTHWVLAEINCDNVGIMKEKHGFKFTWNQIAQTSEEICKACNSSDNIVWGFRLVQDGSFSMLILDDSGSFDDINISRNILNTLKNDIEAGTLLTVSIGMARLEKDEMKKMWKIRCNKYLEIGKKNGKNVIISKKDVKTEAVRKEEEKEKEGGSNNLSFEKASASSANGPCGRAMEISFDHNDGSMSIFNKFEAYKKIGPFTFYKDKNSNDNNNNNNNINNYSIIRRNKHIKLLPKNDIKFVRVTNDMEAILPDSCDITPLVESKRCKIEEKFISNLLYQTLSHERAKASKMGEEWDFYHVYEPASEKERYDVCLLIKYFDEKLKHSRAKLYIFNKMKLKASLIRSKFLYNLVTHSKGCLHIIQMQNFMEMCAFCKFLDHIMIGIVNVSRPLLSLLLKVSEEFEVISSITNEIENILFIKKNEKGGKRRRNDINIESYGIFGKAKDIGKEKESNLMDDMLESGEKDAVESESMNRIINRMNINGETGAEINEKTMSIINNNNNKRRLLKRKAESLVLNNNNINNGNDKENNININNNINNNLNNNINNNHIDVCIETTEKLADGTIIAAKRQAGSGDEPPSKRRRRT